MRVGHVHHVHASCLPYCRFCHRDGWLQLLFFVQGPWRWSVQNFAQLSWLRCIFVYSRLQDLRRLQTLRSHRTRFLDSLYLERNSKKIKELKNNIISQPTPKDFRALFVCMVYLSEIEIKVLQGCFKGKNGCQEGNIHTLNKV